MSQTLELSRNERLRYYEILGQVDEKSAYIELIATQIVEYIEAIGVNLDDKLKKELGETLTEFNNDRTAIYGDCVKPIVVPFL